MCNKFMCWGVRKEAQNLEPLSSIYYHTLVHFVRFTG